MALLRGNLFAGALFAGALIGSQAEITVPPQVVPPPQTAGFGGGYFPKETPQLRLNQKVNKGSKLHLAELYNQTKQNKDLEDIEVKNKLLQQDEELLTIISFMVANRIIV